MTALHRLPDRISAVILGTTLLFLATTVVSVVWMASALNRQALDQSQVQVQVARDDLLGRVRLLTIDYTKWDEADAAVRGADRTWIFDYIGSAAMMGRTFQLAVVWGGALPRDLGWTTGGGTAARPGLLPAALLAGAEGRLARDAAETAEFFAWRGGELFAMGTSRFEPVEHAHLFPEADRRSGQLMLGLRVGPALMADLAHSLLLTGVALVADRPTDRPAVALPGLHGTPAAYLTWSAPRPGTRLLWRMLPLLALVALAATALALIGTRLTRRNAQGLVLAERRASLAARTDALTGLPNRAAFGELLDPSARAGERAVLFLDVNDFKRINDSIGHEAGDRVLLVLAERLADLAGPDRILARTAGDEFAFVLRGPDAGAQAQALAERALLALEPAIEVLGHRMQVAVAMGYAVQADDALQGPDLLRQADLAMDEAKRQRGRATPVAFSAIIGQAARDALAIEQGLREALRNPGELSIAYQPIVGRTGRLERAEALARWTSPRLGSVPPGRFIAVAEQAGLIVELGRRLFHLVCDDLAAHPALRVSLNVSTLQLMAPDFIPSLVDELRARGIPPARIEIELTEAVVVDDPRLAAQRVEELREAGFSIALDDFGTGYSSVGYLEQFRFDTLKIDRSFVARVHRSAGGMAVVDGMIRMAHGLDLRVVCEGIESARDLDLLRELGSDLAQGYHLDQPLPIDELVSRWLDPEPGSAAA
ncbi:putative bifunctional diguanylate cyclase/phosphodiesterase [Rubellimicrobium aerolatum]|uniref:Bifunctional diguanylate cyclase/phosphodiesterase n=1 Tax=Rubellimicrobium aerolatum TaxID=490979 RepID=A0ABW0SE67_9RHOB|nr:bifunctional diguanylate cyclase/phosphodiesterase [Rubellimicrobium aerolatum]MBP1806796.1 diguanylate cyclase (GGDEF)-like protein [Rubellimicrobium aerolatum]